MFVPFSSTGCLIQRHEFPFCQTGGIFQKRIQRFAQFFQDRRTDLADVPAGLVTQNEVDSQMSLWCVDLTREQFDLYGIPVSYEPYQEIPREYCGRNADTLKRYRLLQKNIMLYLKP